MKKTIVIFVAAVLLAACSINETPTEDKLPVVGPIQLHPENQHYFLYKGKPLALITSAEYYGAVLNLDFDYKTYLRTLSNDGMNYTRIFSGTYFEIAGESFGIQNNTLAPEKNKIITPWGIVVNGQTGTWEYDLSSWNDAYFERLKDFMTMATEYDIIVEVTLFSSIYRDKHWDICPQNPVNNVNMTGELSRFDAQTLNNGDLLSYQIAFVRKMVNELNEYDNLFFEIQNEPWSDHTVPVYNIVNKDELRANDWTFKADFADDASMAWQEKIASEITKEEEGLAKKHLIAQNYTNFRASIPELSENISIINFHYAWPETAQWNYHYNKVLGFDESGFAGSGDQVYRRQAWLKILSDFLHGFDLPKLHPSPSCVYSSPGLIPYVLSDQNGSFAVYLRATGTESTSLLLETGNGNFLVQALNTITGSYNNPVILTAREGRIAIDVEIPEGELAIKITKE